MSYEVVLTDKSAERTIRFRSRFENFTTALARVPHIAQYSSFVQTVSLFTPFGISRNEISRPPISSCNEACGVNGVFSFEIED